MSKKQTPNDRKAADLLALRLRLSGLTFEQIAQTPRDEKTGTPMYTNASGAWKAVDRLLRKQVEETRSEYVRLETMRLDELQSNLWAKALQGDEKAIELALKIVDRRMRLHGVSGGGIFINNQPPASQQPNGSREIGAQDAYRDFNDRAPLMAAREYLEAEFKELEPEQ